MLAVPRQTCARIPYESALNTHGYTLFDGLAADRYPVMVGSEAVTLGAVSCRLCGASGSGVGVDIEPNLGAGGTSRTWAMAAALSARWR